MLRFNPLSLQPPYLSLSSISPPFPSSLPSIQPRPKPLLHIPKSTPTPRMKPANLHAQIQEDGAANEIDTDFDEDEDEFSPRGRFRGRGEEERDYDRDPEFAEIIGSCLDDPQKARSKFEFYNAPLEKDVSLICDAIRAWHITGRLGGCNSLNMQLSQSPMDKRPNYDAIQGANVSLTTFYNIGDLEIQDNLARVWVDIGTSEPLILDVLVNALTQISSDYIGIKQVMFGRSKFENWRENLKTDDAGFSVHTI